MSTEDPNAGEKELERQREESLRRDKEGTKEPNKTPVDNSQNEVIKENEHADRQDPEEEENSIRDSARQEEEQEELASQRRQEVTGL